jgi:hypothetical protein
MEANINAFFFAQSIRLFSSFNFICIVAFNNIIFMVQNLSNKGKEKKDHVMSEVSSSEEDFE